METRVVIPRIVEGSSALGSNAVAGAWALGAALLLLRSATASHAATTPDTVSASPDVSIELGALSADEDLALDDLAGSVTLIPLGSLPGASDVNGYEELPPNEHLLCFDSVVELPGSVVVSSGDVALYDGSAYYIDFDASANGVPDGVGCDAVGVDGSGNRLLSFDTTVGLPGGVTAHDEDVVRVDGASTYSLIFDGDALGVPATADVDGFHLLPGGNFAVSLDVTATVGGVLADDEDILEYDANLGTWSLLFDGSAQDPDWAAADVDAIAVPEPGLALMLVTGAAGLLVIGRGRIVR